MKLNEGSAFLSDPEYRLAVCLPLVAGLLAGCVAPVPRDFDGAWTAINRFPESAVEIPLSPTYAFYASPLDGTLRNMLRRWAADTGLQLAYQAPSDYVLHQPVTRIRTPDLQAAVGELGVIYARHGITISSDNRRLVVQPLVLPQVTDGARDTNGAQDVQ